MHHRCCTLVFQLSNKLITPPPPHRLHMTQGEDYKRSIGGGGGVWVKYRKETAIRNILDSG